MNLAQVPEAERPAIDTREPVPGYLEARCTCCGQWRAGFLIEPDPELGWACDARRSAAARAHEAESA